ncbi:DUF2975 domain-containing protein [Luethyella okanaganae]|uniref:DUF2975 domain-containing protein n=1 Tax=Luethyella okanaganae TaxID=69372 RepID=A0ABW1VFU8_9MICO
MPDTSRINGISRGDRASLALTIGGGIVAGVVTIVLLAQRILEIVPNRDVPVPAQFIQTPAELPIGPGGSLVAVSVDEATIRVSDMPGITVFALVASAIVTAVTICAILACVCLFCRNLIRGEAFSRANIRLVMIAAMTIMIGWAVGNLFAWISLNGAFAALSEHGYDNPIFLSFTPTPLFVAIALGAIGVAFQIGAKLQRETEGLV